eukprot:365741-Chlamydomonas_euryale.AAC.8
MQGMWPVEGRLKSVPKCFSVNNCFTLFILLSGYPQDFSHPTPGSVNIPVSPASVFSCTPQSSTSPHEGVPLRVRRAPSACPHVRALCVTACAAVMMLHQSTRAQPFSPNAEWKIEDQPVHTRLNNRSEK